MTGEDPAGRDGVVAALRRCAVLAGRARDAETGVVEALLAALDPLLAGTGPGPGGTSSGAAWDAVGDHVVTLATAGLPADRRRATADDLAALLDDLADGLARA